MLGFRKNSKARYLFVILLGLFFAPFAAAQLTTVTGTVKDVNGVSYSGAQMKAQLVTTAGSPVTGQPTVTVNNQGQCVSAGLGSAPCQMPFPGTVSFTLDPNGNVPGGGINLQDNTQITPGGTQWLVTVNTSGNAPPLGTGPQVCSAQISVSGNSQSISANFSACPALGQPSIGAPGGSPGQTQVNNNGAMGGTPCLTFPNLTSGPTASNCDFQAKGPNPYVDVRAYGVRAVNPNVAPAITGVTANCTSGQNQVTISSASTFQNGDGTVLYGCGAAHSMTTPGAPTVTPSVALAGTATNITTPGPTGATTYNYYLIARDKAQGLTAPSLVGTTTTGAASLGSQTVNITSMSASNQTVTVTTAANHGFLVGCGVLTCGEVFINSANGLSDSTFVGWFTVTSAANGTTFTFIRPGDTRLGASTSATGGTATWFNLNKVTWTNVTGSVEVAVYSDRASAGTCAFIGTSWPNNSVFNETEFDDFGSPMMNGYPRPFFFPASFPCASPPAATSDSLSTTIASGAGTTTLTLANNAGTTITGTPILFDDGPGFLAAVAAGVNGNCTLEFPFDASGNSYVFNSWTTATLLNCGVLQQGNLYLNDTLEVLSGNANNSVSWLGGSPVAKQTSNAFSSYPTVNVNVARPGMVFSHPQFGLHISRLQFAGVNGGNGNGSLALVTDDGFNQTFDWLNFNQGTGANDFMSMGHMSRSLSGQSATNVTYDFAGFNPGGGSSGVSHTPTLFVRNAGSHAGIWNIKDTYSIHRGMLFNGIGPVSLGVNGIAYLNGSGTPLLTTYALSNTNGPFVIVGNAVLDTVAHPAVASLQNSVNSASVQFLNGLPSASSGVLGLSGSAGGGVVGAGNLTFANSFNGSSGLQGIVNVPTAVGSTNASFFVNGAAPTGVTCAVVAGGTDALNTYTFKVVPVWQNGLEGALSATSPSCTTTSGNQTININWTGVSGNPLGYNVYLSNGGGFSKPSAGTCTSPQTTGLSATWSNNTFCGVTASTIVQGGPTMFLPGVQGMAMPAMILTGSPPYTGTAAGGPVASAAYSTVSASVTASIGSTTMVSAPSNGQKFLFNATIYQTALGVGCTGNTTVQLSASWKDAGSAVVINTNVPAWSFAAQAFQSVPVLASAGNGILGNFEQFQPMTMNVASGTAITFATTYTLGAGCTTSPAYYVVPQLLQVQ